MCAIKAGRSVASTMGFTAVDGLPMGTRCGALDPGVVLYLMDELKMDARAIEKLLYQQSGLLGVSGISSDMRTLLESTEPRAKLAIDLFVYRIGRELGSLAAALGGLDALVFTGGIGEHAAQIRERVCRDAAWLGVELDAAANGGGPRISTASSRVAAWVIPTNEELMIARHTRALLAADAGRLAHDTRNSAPAAEGQESAGCRRRQRPVDRLRLRESVSRARRRARDHLRQREDQDLRRAAREGAGGADLPCRSTSRSRASSRRCSRRSAKKWGRLDILVHSIAWAPKDDLQGGLLNCSAEGFKQAMDISCHSFVRMARLAAPLMKDGGTMFAMSYYGANRVVPNYNVMGPVKAALEASCRYLAYELGGKGIRVHAISPGPLKTRAASGLKDFDLLLNAAAQRAPLGELVDIMDVGFTCAYLATPYARRLSGETMYVDGGVNIMA